MILKRAAFLAMLVLGLSSQSREVLAGFRVSAFGYPVVSWLQVSTDPTVGAPRLGWGVGASMEWGLAKWLGVELTGLYAKRVVGGPLNSESEFSYAQVPLQFRVWSNQWLSFALGGYVGFALGGVVNRSGQTSSGLTYSSLGYSRWDWGGVASAGIQYPLIHHWYLFIDSRFMYGMQNIELVPLGTSVSHWLELSVIGGLRLGTF